MAENPKYVAPQPPRSAKAMYTKIRKDPDYAEFIRGQLEVALYGKTKEEKDAALDVLDSHFALNGDELSALELPALAKCRTCTNTNPTLFLLDFALATETWPSAE